ncbi:7839_t:CDS:2, partial [Paraglomus brasilianum]
GILCRPVSKVKKAFTSEVCSPEISGDENGVRVRYVPVLPFRSDEALNIRDKIVDEVERFRRAEMKKKGKHLRSCPDKRITVNTYERKYEELKGIIPKPSDTYPIWALREHIERQ